MGRYSEALFEYSQFYFYALIFMQIFLFIYVDWRDILENNRFESEPLHLMHKTTNAQKQQV